MSWNVNGEVGVSEERMKTQLEFLDNCVSDADIFMFQAVDYERQGEGEWGGQLGSLLEHFESIDDEDYCFAHTADWAHELAESTVQPHQAINSPHERCNLTVSRFPVKRTPLSLRSDGNGYPQKLTYYTTHFPESLLVGELNLSNADEHERNEMEVWNVGIINGANWHEEKIKMLETVYARIYLRNQKTDQPVVLGGDFNAPKREHENGTIVPHGDGTPEYTRQHYPFYGSPYYFEGDEGEMEEFTFRDRWKAAESNVFDPDVGRWDMRDAYWVANEGSKKSAVDEYTHEIASGGRKRLDHILVSSHFDVDRCEILLDEMDRDDGPDASDHAPVVGDFF